MISKAAPEKLKFTLSEKDYIAFNYYVAWARPQLKWKRLLRRILVPLMLVLIALPRINESGFKYADFAIFAIGLAYALFVHKLIYWGIKRRIRKIYKADNQRIYGLKEYTILENTLNINEGHSKSVSDWQSFESLTETKEYFFLNLSKIQAWIIPKRAFKNNNELEKFKQFVNFKIRG